MKKQKHIKITALLVIIATALAMLVGCNKNDNEQSSQYERDIITYAREGNYIYFGEYPQTLMAEGVTITQDTDSRGYYLGSDGKYYAMVKATPYDSSFTFSTGASIKGGEVYYFKVEPIRWRIISEENGEVLLLCDSIISNCRFDDVSDNYVESEIRAWLNSAFYESAFSELQKELILTTDLGDSNDKIFLMSKEEAENSSYGFTASDTYDDSRKMSISDYSRATGAYISTSSDYKGNGWWWLRTSYTLPEKYIDDCYSCVIHSHGIANCGHSIDRTDGGVVPMLKITLR